MLDPQDALRLSYSLTKAVSKDYAPPKRPKKRYKVRDFSTGNYLTYQGQTIWMSQKTALARLADAIWDAEYETRSDASYGCIREFIKHEVGRGRIILEEIEA